MRKYLIIAPGKGALMKYRKWDSKTKAKIVLEFLQTRTIDLFQSNATAIRYHKSNITNVLKNSIQSLIKSLTLQEKQRKNSVSWLKTKSSSES